MKAERTTREQARCEDVDEGEGGGGVGGRAKRRAKGLKGSLERSGGWRMLRCMLKLRSARFACGTYLRGRGRAGEGGSA